MDGSLSSMAFPWRGLQAASNAHASARPKRRSTRWRAWRVYCTRRNLNLILRTRTRPSKPCRTSPSRLCLSSHGIPCAIAMGKRRFRVLRYRWRWRHLHALVRVSRADHAVRVSASSQLSWHGHAYSLNSDGIWSRCRRRSYATWRPYRP